MRKSFIKSNLVDHCVSESKVIQWELTNPNCCWRAGKNHPMVLTFSIFVDIYLFNWIHFFSNIWFFSQSFTI